MLIYVPPPSLPHHWIGWLALPLLKITLFETTKGALQDETWSALVVYACLDIHRKAVREFVTALISVTCDLTFNSTYKNQ